MSVSILEILGHLPRRMEDYIYVCSMTYETWTESDIESGDTDNRGYLYADQKLSHADVMAELSMFTKNDTSCWPIPDDDQKCNFWLTTSKLDFITGITEVHSFHVHRILIPKLDQADSWASFGIIYDHAWVKNSDMCQLMRDAEIM